MNNRLLHTPEGVRDIYGKEYARKLAVEQKLQNAIHCLDMKIFRHPPLNFRCIFQGDRNHAQQGTL